MWDLTDILEAVASALETGVWLSREGPDEDEELNAACAKVIAEFCSGDLDGTCLKVITGWHAEALARQRQRVAESFARVAQ